MTGASGFIGSELMRRFRRANRTALGLARHPAPGLPPDIEVVGDLAATDDATLDDALEGAVAVVHLAGRAHVMKERDADPSRAYRHANVEATRRLAVAARRVGAARFVLASTVKVNGETTRTGHPFRPGDEPHPEDAYARSKLEAERVLHEICEGSVMSAVVLRLPLVYGRHAKGNFARLVAAVRKGRPLPLGAIRNRRSLLYVGNLLDAIEAVLDAPVAPAGVHFVADDAAVSTAALVRAIAAAWHVHPPLSSIPVPLLRLGATLLGRRSAIARLAGSLEVDTTSLREATRWRPRYTLAAGLAEMAAGRHPDVPFVDEGASQRPL